MKVLIAGGGIGGLALALALHEAGVSDVAVYEASPTISELGVGINVLPHAVRELSEMGLGDALADVAIPTEELAYYSSHGQRIWSEPRGLAAGYRWPQFSIHRGALLRVLHDAVRARLGEACIRTTHRCIDWRRDASGSVSATFDDPTGHAARIHAEGDLLVGCDGVHSTVRRMLFPDEGPPLWNGITMWRGVTVAPPFLTGRTMVMVGCFGRRVVAYPISKRHEQAGSALVNWVAELRNAPDQPMPVQDWTHAADADDVVRAFASFTFGFLDAPALARDAATVYKYPMVDREPLPTWDFGCVTLLGDAAHPMYPVGSNGASQAILDARVLARELALQPTVGAAVAAYDAARRPATAAVVRANRLVGPERCMDLVEARAPSGFSRLSDVVTDQELLDLSRAYKKTAGFDLADLNSRPSLSVGPNRATPQS
jgi:2-polyprenyl-6-methoxyphenol hydroxylase-like FAD-dependent oxidoreductase